jgi:TPR repeat protein
MEFAAGARFIDDPYDPYTKWLSQVALACGSQRVLLNEVEEFEWAVKWFHLPAKQGPAHAFLALGLCCEEGQGSEKDGRKAVEWT